MLNSSRPTASFLLGACVAAGLGFLAVSPARGDDVAIFKKLLEQRGPSVVTLKFVLKIKGGGGEQESETEISGVMIDPKGLVICSGTQTGGFNESMRRRIGRGGDFSVTPTDMKVLIGDDSEGVEAKIVARDTDLDLAWVQITKPADKPYDYVDLSKGPSARPGEEAFVVRRMDKFFDRAEVISEGWIAGVVKKPRELYVPGGTIGTANGLAAFNANGDPLGFLIMQMSDEDESRSARGASGTFILPNTEVIKATQRARESAASGKAVDSDADADPDSEKKPADKDADKDADSKDTKSKSGDSKSDND